MKKFTLFLFLLTLCTQLPAQLNLTLRDQFSYGEIKLNDVWGWHHAPTNKEYALVGARTGVSIVEVTDPDNIVERAFLPGATSVWRDLKTWGDFAYVTNEEDNGVEVIYLGDLPGGGEVTSYNWEPVLPTGDTLRTCHNLYIDEFGYAYLAGCNPINNGGVIVVDVFSEPGNPLFVSFGKDVYSHDVYVRDNILYSSEIGEGRFTVFDVSDKQNIIELGSSPTLFETTHNAWLSDDGDYLFTTDEKANATVGSYLVSDPTDIEALDNYRPEATLGTGVIPHNTHVLDDYLITSYYTDGGIITDASDPENLVEVGNYDTNEDFTNGFHGTWGAYPFLPSGLILLSDIENGLFVLSPEYIRAARLEGTVTDAVSGTPVAFTEVVIEAVQLNSALSDFTGEYKTGIAAAGTYEVTYTAPGYIAQTLTVTLENGQTVIQDIQLNEAPRYDLTGTLVRADNGAPVPFGQIQIHDGFFTYDAVADSEGVFTFEQIFEGEYNAIAGAWHYEYAFRDFSLSEDTDITIAMNRGYQDDFLFDLNWEISGDALTGQWERAEPVETIFDERRANPKADLSSDYGTFAYVTGNSDLLDEVSGGTVTLTSPPMDLTIFEEPFVRYQLWFFNRAADGSSDPDDVLEVRISNGTDEVLLQTQSASNSFWQSVSSYDLNDFIEITDNMRLIVETSDPDNSHVIEAAFDAFRITEGSTTSLSETALPAIQMYLAPNPFDRELRLDYQLSERTQTAFVTVYNQIGQPIQRTPIRNPSGSLTLGENWKNGIYWLLIEADGEVKETRQVIKF